MKLNNFKLLLLYLCIAFLYLVAVFIFKISNLQIFLWALGVVLLVAIYAYFRNTKKVTMLARSLLRDKEYGTALFVGLLTAPLLVLIIFYPSLGHWKGVIIGFTIIQYIVMKKLKSSS